MMFASRDRRGQSMVEFALVLPIFVLILVGIFDFGRAIYAFNTISNAAREGARLAIVDQTVSHVQEVAAGASVSLDILPEDVIVDFRFWETPDDPGSCQGAKPGDDDNEASIVQCLAVVTVPYEYEAATPIIGSLLGMIDMKGESRFKVDFNCEGPECPHGD